MGGPILRSKHWLSIGTAVLFLSSAALAKDHGHGKHHDDDDRGQYYSEHDRDDVRRWYHDSDDHLPPGLAKRDRLPPGLEKQLRVRGTLPPGLRKKMEPCPEEVERRLPPPPPGCEHTIIGGHVVLVNRSSYVVLDIIHFEQ
jgi:Ni/Co efflux regulator RcnB